MRKDNLGWRSRAAALLLFAAQSILIHAGTTPVTNADELVAHHLDALGSAQARSDAKTRVAQGTAEFKILVGGAGTLDGKSVFVSQGAKLHFMMKFPNNDYRGEQFIFNEDKVEVSSATARQSRSALGGFLYTQDVVLREGLWGGVLSTAWPLLDLEKHKAKVSFDGLKKLDGQDLYELRYQPRKNTDLEIRLYFDPETCRHVETVYTLNISPSVVNSETANARQQESRFRLEERFSDFKTVDGLTLPTEYTIHFTQELQTGRTTVSEWKLQETDLANNTALDERNFAVK
jgi:hypothetical protein